MNHAVDPSIVSSWERLQRILSQFGFDKIRLIARVPGKWHDHERSKIVARLRDFEDLVCVPRQHDWSKARTWLENVKAIHANDPFTLILTAIGEQIALPIVPYTELDESNPPQGWIVSGRVERRKEAMAKALRLVLQSARRFVRFVDPYFHPLTPRFLATMTEYLQSIRTVRDRSAYPEIQIHTSNEQVPKAFTEQCEDRDIQ